MRSMLFMYARSLQNNNHLYIKREKLKFYVTTNLFLAYVIRQNGVAKDQKKVQLHFGPRL